MEFAKQMFHICESGVRNLPERGPQVADIGVVVVVQKQQNHLTVA
jgi:3-deoxy-D-arabino-heptulosonate 7-phosphate (DAHP) synthase